MSKANLIAGTKVSPSNQKKKFIQPPLAHCVHLIMVPHHQSRILDVHLLQTRAVIYSSNLFITMKI
jgi:hypothetical protein